MTPQVVITPAPPAGKHTRSPNPVPLPSQPADCRRTEWRPGVATLSAGNRSADRRNTERAAHGPHDHSRHAGQEPIYPPTPQAWDLRASLIPPDARNGFFQKASSPPLTCRSSTTTAWVGPTCNWEVMTALPFFTRENPILITPAYEWHLLDRPQGFDLPSRLNDLTMDFHVFRVYENSWIFDFAVTPGLFADDHSLDSSDACRVNGRGVAVYVPSPEWKWLLGVQYVNGAWDKIVPIAGFVYEPSDDVKYEAVFPRPRAAWRLPMSPVPGRDEYWFYLLGEFTNIDLGLRANRRHARHICLPRHPLHPRPGAQGRRRRVAPRGDGLGLSPRHENRQQRPSRNWLR